MSSSERSPAPRLVVPPPGPRAAALVAADARFLSPSYTRPYPLAVARGQGCWIEDLDGNRFLDCTAGIAVCTTGHCHPRVVAAIRHQSERLIHMCGADFYYEPLVELARKLAEIAPGPDDKRVLFTNSGTEAIEAAIKLARHHTGRPYLVAFHGAFHGRTLGALSLTASKAVQRRGFAPLLPAVVHAPFPDPYRPPLGAGGDVAAACLAWLEKLFRSVVPAGEVAAVVVEPIQGESGYVVPSEEFLRRLQELCRRHGILLIADEVQSGMGRTGRMFASEHFALEPDILCLAKGLASGMPLGAIVARADVMDWEPGAHASTFGGNPVSCAAALETLALLEEGLIENASRVGQFFLEGLGQLQRRHRQIGDVRGKGLMIGIDLVEDRATRQPAVKARDSVLQLAFHKGLLLLGCGDSVVRISPPLVITPEEAETALAILDQVLTEAEGSAPAA